MHCHSIRLVWFQFALSRFHAHAWIEQASNKIWKVNYANYRLVAIQYDTYTKNYFFSIFPLVSIIGLLIYVKITTED